MKITGTHNQLAELKLHAFQFGRASMMPDEDWIEVKLELLSPAFIWHATDPSLTTAEVFMLYNWLMAVAEGKPVDKDLFFLEPTLSFHLMHERQESKVIKVVFDHELRPFRFYYENEYVMICRLTNDQLRRCARSLLRELAFIYAKAGYSYVPRR